MAAGNSYPAVALDQDGRVVDSQTVIQFTDAADQPSRSGGGSQPHTQATYDDSITIAAGDSANASWGDAAGDELLDLTDPENPTIVVTGTYAFTCQIGTNDDLTGVSALVTFAFNPDGENPPNVNLTLEGSAAGAQGIVPFTWYLVAGTVVRFTVENDDGDNPHDFSFIAFVQRIG